MAKSPTSWETALTEAERSCFDYLCETLGLREGASAFISVNNGAVDCAVFDIGYPQTGDQFGFSSATSFHFRGQVDFYARSRTQIQRWLMRLLWRMPVSRHQGVATEIAENSNVECFRIAPQTQAISSISTTELKSGAGTKGIEVFTASVLFDIVFTCGDRAAQK